MFGGAVLLKETNVFDEPALQCRPGIGCRNPQNERSEEGWPLLTVDIDKFGGGNDNHHSPSPRYLGLLPLDLTSLSQAGKLNVARGHLMTVFISPPCGIWLMQSMTCLPPILKLNAAISTQLPQKRMIGLSCSKLVMVLVGRLIFMTVSPSESPVAFAGVRVERLHILERATKLKGEAPLLWG